MKKKIKHKYKFFFLFILILFVYQNNIHYDFYKIINSNYEKRINKAYGNCNNYGYQFIEKSLSKIEKFKKIAIYNANDLAGIKWMFSDYKDLKYLNNLNSNLKTYDYLILISYSKKNLKIYENKVFIESLVFNIKNKFNNCYLLSKL